MNTEQRINMAAAYKMTSQAALARTIGMTPSNFNQKIKRDSLTREEMQKIAEALGATYTPECFEFPDGTKL
jgi:DNA-binding transcriptional regulator YdaS (Cro superfamily)